MSDYTFVRGLPHAPNLADDPRLAAMAAAVANQQRAGFKRVIDLRQFACPACKAPGFNTGWGDIAFICGGAIVGEEWSAPCPTQGPPAPSVSEERAHG